MIEGELVPGEKYFVWDDGDEEAELNDRFTAVYAFSIGRKNYFRFEEQRGDNIICNVWDNFVCFDI